MHVQQVCAAIEAKYKCSLHDDDATTSISCCNLAKDLGQVIDRMLNDDTFFSYCEYHGPVGLEGLAGNPVFYMAHYGLEGGMSVRAKKKMKMKSQSKTGHVKKCKVTNVLSDEQLQTTTCPKENLLDVTGLSLLLKKHRSNVQSVQTELQASRHKHHHKQHESYDLKPRQRELVEKTLGEIFDNAVGCNAKPSYADMIHVLSGSDKPSVTSCHDTSAAESLGTEKQVKPNEPDPHSSKQCGSAVLLSGNSIPVTLPSSISSSLRKSILGALSDFDSIVESVRLKILKERNKLIAKTTEQSNADVEFDATSVDFSAVDAARRTTIQSDVRNQSTYGVDRSSSMYEENSVSMGGGRKALDALLSASTTGKQQEKKSLILDDYWNLQEEQLFEVKTAAEDECSRISDGVDEFSLSTGAGKNAISMLLALSEYGDAVQTEKRKRRSKRRSPSSDDSSLSDSSTEVGKLALNSLLSMATVNDKPTSNQAKRSAGRSTTKKTNTLKPSPAKRKRAGASEQKTEPNSEDGDAASQATGGGKRALAELLASV
jgi:hypothetical protein